METSQLVSFPGIQVYVEPTIIAPAGPTRLTLSSHIITLIEFATFNFTKVGRGEKSRLHKIHKWFLIFCSCSQHCLADEFNTECQPELSLVLVSVLACEYD